MTFSLLRMPSVHVYFYCDVKYALLPVQRGAGPRAPSMITKVIF